MSISLDALNNLENNSSYYLSDSGEVKKAGFGQWVKCLFGFGGGRTRVANLINEIRKSLIATTENNNAATVLDENLSRKSIKSLKGSEIKELVKNFKVLNDIGIAKTSAKKLLDNQINVAINTTSPSEQQGISEKLTVDPSALRDFIMRGEENYLKNPPLKEITTTVTNENGQSETKTYKKLDMQTAQTHFNNDIIMRKNLLKEVVNTKKLKNLSQRYLEYINKTLYDKEGNRNEIPIKDLKNPDEVLKDLFYSKISKSKNDPNVQKNVDFIIKECQEDPDLQDIVEKRSCLLRLTANTRLKSEEQTSSNLKKLKDCLKKAKELSNGNKKMLNQYKMFIAEKGLKISPEILTSMSDKVNTMPLDKLRSLNAKSSAKEFHDAMKQVNDNIEILRTSEEICRFASASDDRSFFAELIDALILSKLSPQEKSNLMEAFSSANANKAKLAYKHFEEISVNYNLSAIDYSPLPDSTEKLPLYFAFDETNHISDNMSVMINILSDQLDTTAPDIDKYFTKQGYKEYNVKELIKEIGKNTVEKTRDIVNDYLDNHISGSDTKFIRDIMYQRIMNLSSNTIEFGNTLNTKYGYAANFNSYYSDLVKPAVRASMQWNICAALKKCSADPKTTYFARDLTVGGFEITLPGGKKLNNDFEKACNELAQYVTKNEAATYNSLSKEDKLKVNLIISVCSQETCTSLATESQRSMSPNGSVIYSPSYSGDPVVNKFNVSIGEDGSLSVSYEGKRHVATLEKKDSGEFFHLDAEQSYLGSSLNLKFEPDEIKRLSELDFSKYDDKKVMEEYLASDDANKIKKITETIPKDFRVSFDLSTDMELKTVSQAE